MIDNPFRAFLAHRVDGLVRFYERLGLTPNAISLMSLGVAVLAALTVAAGANFVALALWWVGRLLDGTDGIFARKTGQASLFGSFLDISCDMAAYSAMIVGFFGAQPELAGRWILIVALYVLCITGALALGSLSEQAESEARKSDDGRLLNLGAGLAEGGETGIAYTLFLLWPQHTWWLSVVWIGVLSVTVISRGFLARRILASSA